MNDKNTSKSDIFFKYLVLTGTILLFQVFALSDPNFSRKIKSIPNTVVILLEAILFIYSIGLAYSWRWAAKSWLSKFPLWEGSIFMGFVIFSFLIIFFTGGLFIPISIAISLTVGPLIYMRKHLSRKQIIEIILIILFSVYIQFVIFNMKGYV